jgi:hypothetical protein
MDLIALAERHEPQTSCTGGESADNWLRVAVLEAAPANDARAKLISASKLS